MEEYRISFHRHNRRRDAGWLNKTPIKNRSHILYRRPSKILCPGKRYKVYIRMVNDKKHYFPYLQTTPDNIKKNNLYGLPPCTEKDGEPLPPWQEGEDGGGD